MLPSGSGKNPQFFSFAERAKKKYDGGEKYPPVRKIRIFFFQKGDRKPNQFSTNSLCLNCFFNQFSILAKMILYSSHPTSTKKRLRKIEWSECLKKTSDPSMKKLFLVSTSRNIYIYIYVSSLSKDPCCLFPSPSLFVSQVPSGAQGIWSDHLGCPYYYRPLHLAHFFLGGKRGLTNPNVVLTVTYV